MGAESSPAMLPKQGRAGAFRRIVTVIFACILTIGILAPFEANATLQDTELSKAWNKDSSAALKRLNREVLLIGDSQSSTPNTWVQQALRAVNYRVNSLGTGGIGYVAATSKSLNYADALAQGQWAQKMPPTLRAASPGRSLIVVQGGGNDATRGATDQQITNNANGLLNGLEKMYPKVEIVMIGAIGKGLNNDGGRRSQVDALLGGIAKKRGLSFISVGDWWTRYKVTDKLVDGIHLNAAGHTILAAALKQKFLEL